MAKKEITLEMTGWVIKGTCAVSLWGGGDGSTNMRPSFIPIGKMTKANLIGAVNDGGFGVQSIDEVLMDIYSSYGCNQEVQRYERTIFLGEDDCIRYHQYFNKGVK